MVTRDQAVAAIAEMERRRRVNPIKYVKEHNKQREITARPERIRAAFWGNRVGKTEWGAHEVTRYAIGEHPFRQLDPPYEIWSICPSFDAQEDTTQKKLLACLPPGRIKSRSNLRGNILRSIEIDNGVRIRFMSYEQAREKFQGAGKRLIWFDEEPPKDIWDECLARIEAGQDLDVILTMTPIKGMTWVYDDLYLNTSDPDIFISTAGWIHNPWLTEKQIEEMSRRYTEDALLVRRDGKFVKRVGLVCNWWDRDKHVRHYDDLDKDWTWFEVLDGGFSDPAAWLLMGVDSDNNVHVVDGFRKRYLTTERIKELRDVKVSGLTITNGWIDNDDPRLKDDLSKAGMKLENVVKLPNESKNWDETLASKLDEYGKVQAGSGEPRLYISDNLVEVSEKTGKEENWLVQEIENLVWLETRGRQGEEIKPRWDDHRRFGHHFDGVRALSYFLVSYMKPKKDDGSRVCEVDEISDEYGFFMGV